MVSMRRKIEKITVNEFLDKLINLKAGKVLRVAFKENDKNRQSPDMCESFFLTVADCDVRIQEDKKDGKKHIIFSVPIDHPNGSGEVIGEVCCCYDKSISADDLKLLCSKKKNKKNSPFDEDTINFTTVVKQFAGLTRERPNFEWFDHKEYDYDLYLKESWKADNRC